MTTSRTTFLSKPSGDSPVKRATLAYVLARGRQQAFNLIVSEFKKSGISQAVLARRLGKGTDQISRLLRRPSNLEIDTLTAVVFALSGAAPRYGLDFPSTPKREVDIAAPTQSQATSNNVVQVPQGWTEPLKAVA